MLQGIKNKLLQSEYLKLTANWLGLDVETVSDATLTQTLWWTGKLQEKAELRNPDEFYHKMRNAKFEDGAHVIMRSNEASTEKARKLSQRANMALVQIGRQVESKKAEKL